MNIPSTDNKKLKILVISPHSDDAALSVSGFLDIFQYSCDIQIITLTGGNGMPDPIWDKRITEDKNFAFMIAARHLQCSIRDARLISKNSSIFDTPNKKRISQFYGPLTQLISIITPDLILLPLGVGGHADHLATFEAGIDALIKHNNRISLLLYEDLPYCALNDGELSDRLKGLYQRGFILHPHKFKISVESSKRTLAVEIYKSQNLERWRNLIIDYLSGMGHPPSEQLWELKHSNLLPFKALLQKFKIYV